MDRNYRRKGVAAVALRGALDLIAEAGGGVVEGYPQDLPEGKKISSNFLYNVTRSLYEQTGFSYDRAQGQEPLRDANDGFTRRSVSTALTAAVRHINRMGHRFDRMGYGSARDRLSDPLADAE